MAKLIAIILGVALHLPSVIAHADVPTIGDMSASSCSMDRTWSYRNRSASPTSRDEVDAATARRGRDAKAVLPGATGAVTQSEDPQIHGMDAQGATDAAYRAAYRVCMRKRGF